VIGVFDSGVGGLSVLSQIRERLPKADLLYVADQARAPYGTKSLAEVAEASDAVASWLIDEGARTVVVACNTASAAALHDLRKRHPGVSFVGMEPAVKPAALSTNSGVIGVLATAATFQGELFASVVRRHASGARVVSAACPEWVQMVEDLELAGPKALSAVADRLRPMIAEGVDTLVLGCTHFPFLVPLIRETAGAGVAVVDPSPAVARQVHRVDREGEGSGTVVFLTSGDRARFATQISGLVGCEGTVLAWAGHGDRHVV